MLDYYNFNSPSNHINSQGNSNFNHKHNSVASAVAMLNTTPYGQHYHQNFGNQHVQSQFMALPSSNNNDMTVMAKPANLFQSVYSMDSTVVGQNNIYSSSTPSTSSFSDNNSFTTACYYPKSNTVVAPSNASTLNDLLMNRPSLGFSGFATFSNAAAANCYLSAVAAAAVGNASSQQQQQQTKSTKNHLLSTTASSSSSSSSPLPAITQQYPNTNVLSVNPATLSTSTTSSNSSSSSSSSPQSAINGKFDRFRLNYFFGFYDEQNFEKFTFAWQ
jgi:hypothetical protein